ncbi:TPA: hypothetical protein EYP70_06460 [Candidatus Bathyarchaeota archaeon]|nr:hypothetical protein [Candidatus Bathyarchaeota archaeon]
MAGHKIDYRDMPRPEHPRPDFYRTEWINLNGAWEFQFDDYDLGMKNEWYLKEVEFNRKIMVPFPFQSILSGVHDEGIHEIVWYRRKFSIPEDWSESAILLHFGAVDYETKVWLNGKFVGSNVGGYAPFVFDITRFIRKNDENILTIRVYDPNKNQPRGKQDPRLHPRGVLYTRVTGIWQTVWLEKVGNPYLSSLRVFPNVDDNSVTIIIGVKGKSENAKVKTYVDFAGIPEAEAIALINNGKCKVDITLRDLKLWSPEIPELYNLKIEIIRGSEVVDRVESYFGMRKISVKNGRLFLNGSPYYLKMALDQGYYPEGLYTAPSEMDLRMDVEIAKKLGLNGIRKHQIASEPRYLYWCDKIGLLVWGEMGDWGMPLNKYEEFWREWKRIIARDFNHPSIIVWVPFNERNEAKKDKENQKALLEIYERTKKADPTRLVIDASGYSHTKTDILDLHEYRMKSGREWREKWSDVFKRGDIPELLHSSLAEGLNYEGQPIVISEFGGWEIELYGPIIDRPIEPRRLTLKDEFEFISRYRDVVDTFMNDEKICGFCYTQLYDVEGEINGFLTYDRKWKVSPEKIREIHEKMLE